MYLTPKIRFAIKNNSNEQRIDGTSLPTNEWHHITVTMGKENTCLYLDGKLIAKTNSLTINPLNFKPVLNYIGRGQTSVPLFNGLIDDFRMYNYAMDSTEINKVLKDYNTFKDIEDEYRILEIKPIPAKDYLNVNYKNYNDFKMLDILIVNNDGKILIRRKIRNNSNIDISNLVSGVYCLKILTSEGFSLEKKIIVIQNNN